MMSWKDIVKGIAPTIGAAIGGPMAGAGVKFLADKLLGNPDATEQDIGDYILSASPDQLVKVKELELEFESKMAELEVDVFRLEVEDRGSARKSHKDNSFVEVLTVILTVMVGAGAYGLMTQDIPPSNANVVTMLFGQIVTAWAGCIAYWVGTTKGSSDKNKMIGGK